jgi:hypothetical protein
MPAARLELPRLTLAAIISKAFMLAEDDKIKDASIRSQIEQAALRAERV